MLRVMDLGPIWRTAFVVGLAGLLVVVTFNPAKGQDPDCRVVVRDRVTGELKIIYTCGGDGEPDVPPPGDPGNGGDADRPADPVADGPDEPHPVCNDVGAVAPGSRSQELRADGSVWERHLFRCEQPDGTITTENRMVCMSGCPAPDPSGGGGPARPSYRSVPDLRLEALGKVDPPLPEVRHSFDQVAESGDVRAIVLAEQWWWLESPPAPVTARAEDGPVWVEVTATPGEMVLDPGDGSGPLTCEAPGVAYDIDVSYYDQVPGEPKGACVHVYEQTSEAMTATVSMSWEFAWEGSTPSSGAMSGTMAPIARSESVTFPVREIQSVITAAGS